MLMDWCGARINGQENHQTSVQEGRRKIAAETAFRQTSGVLTNMVCAAVTFGKRGKAHDEPATDHRV